MHFERGLDGQNGWEVYFYVSFDGMEIEKSFVSKLKTILYSSGIRQVFLFQILT